MRLAAVAMMTSVLLAAACGGAGSARGASQARLSELAYVAQSHRLSCEAAALQMALTHNGIQRTQDAILQLIGIDRTPPVLAAGGSVLHWGDPYDRFVGDPDGSEAAFTGYGVYAPALARAATASGARVLAAAEGVTAAQVYDYVAQQHPVIAWVSMSGRGEYVPQPTTRYVAFDGREVVFGPGFEHTVVVVQSTSDQVRVYDPEPDVGPRWLTKAEFEASYHVFGEMALVLG
jgi:uncharacterized protein YvpB